MKIIFIGGVHGTGKTTMCHSIAQGFGFVHRSASQLIRSAKESAIARDTKVVRDIDSNQKLLLFAIEELRQAGQSILLDGHFSLINQQSEIQKLPVELFAQLKIDATILFFDKPETIAKRLSLRDGNVVDVQFIKAHQEAEIEHASVVASALGLPFFKIHAFDETSFRNTIRARI